MKTKPIFAMLFLSLCTLAVAQENEKKAADAAAQSWLALVDKGDFGASWESAATPFKSALSRTDWEKSLSGSRGQFGKLLSRKLKEATYATSLPGAPDGKYVVIQYETSFQNKKSAIETVTPMVDKDGQWRVSGYYIR
jgi:hypothetical protein